ncbi:2-hydroxyacyl-CoA dehydratase family protein [Desulfosporosinus nitroreducens]|uniref:2-hydroxyacyl-CoA dehydratase family protein n=1 Tax=Desulfosporosinus nitroreducens TaxID=2018668 RepID=A0ABT8QT86_9FIRM|nr:2-hydroxyacyl-CoA dehydratase family protein [Desulfosporosinus nitroreducens]MCO1602890.1 2-hydroxyacyl-CoA dehydratase family protein [Desulfosporosinus nitroreducens]MDO0824577.1 2-hydroxyacyl-CoA dehydratase family protein [Desulfosporosinus nitroreducens]
MVETFNPTDSKESLKLLIEEASLKGADRLNRYPKYRFFGYFCSYFPEELIIAAGLHPLRLLPDSENSTPVELPAYCCSLARGTLDMEVREKWRDLVGIGFTHTCDTMQCLSGIWAASGQSKTVDIVPPVMLKAPGASRYYHAELHTLLSKLTDLTKQKIEAEAIRNALILCANTRKLAAELDVLRPNLPSPLIFSLLRAGQLMPRSEYTHALVNSFPALKEMAEEPHNKAKVLVSSAVLENDSLFEMIEELGGRVVADDTCTGFRHFSGVTVSGSEDPLLDIVRRYSEMPPCPCKNRSLNERISYLTTLAKQRHAQGAIIIVRKYCEPHAWDAATLSESLRKNGIRTLTLELEGANAGGQERTRLQAFLESLLGYEL